MIKVKTIIKNHSFGSILVPKINELLAKKNLTHKEERLLDVMLDVFFKTTY